MIVYNALDVKIPNLPRRKVSNWIKTITEKYNKRVGDVSYIFCSDEKILSINKEYLKHDYFTDIITFDYSANDTISGDIFISLDTVKSNATQFKVPFENEFLRVMIHGILHLCGLSDNTKKQKELMRNSENQALSKFLDIDK